MELTDEKIQSVLDSIREALDTSALTTPFARISAIGIFLNTLNPPTINDIKQAEEIMDKFKWFQLKILNSTIKE